MKTIDAHPRRRPRRRVWLALALASACLLGADPPCAAAAPCGAAAGAVRPASVSQEGEIGLADGRLVRLAGLDLPDPRRGDPALGVAARALISARVVGREVGLVLFAAAPDRWGRLAADLVTPEAGTSDSLAEALLGAGLARVKPEIETRGCEIARLALEAPARAKKLGLWGDPDYSVLAADNARELVRRDGRFAIVEGVATRVGLGRSRFYLDLGGRGDLSVVVPRKSQAALLAQGVALPALTGERIRVRGVLDDRFGPQIELVDPLMLERIGGAGAK